MTMCFSAKGELDKFRELEDGWYYGEGVSFEQSVIEAAACLNGIALNLEMKTEAFPGLDGDVMLSAYADNKSFDFVFKSEDKEIVCYYEYKNGEVEQEECQENMTLQEAEMLLTKYGTGR